MSLFRTALRPSIFKTNLVYHKTNLVYHAQKNKQKYTQQQQIIKRRFHTTPPTPPDKPIALILFLITGYYIYQHTPREPPSSHSPFGLY